MGDRITFRERSHGVSQKTTATGAVSITEPRVRFVKKDVADCGDGTAYPLLVTIDQLHEIAYRVYDAYFTSGSVTYGAPYSTTLSVQNTPSTAKADAETLTGSVFHERGFIYGYKHGTDDLSPERDHLLDTAYHFDTEEYSTNTDGFDYREYKPTRPISQWEGLPESSNLATLAGYTTANDKQFGFRQIFVSDDYGGTATIHGIWATSDATSEQAGGLTSSLEVGYHGADDPYSSAASLYLQITFDLGNPVISFSTLEGGLFDTYICDLVLQLAESSVSCKIYADGTYATSGVDFVCEAVKWWPYETTAGVAAYDTATGLPLNGGAGA